MLRAIALLLTVATGFSGLAYEVAWQRYLATLLGAHSEATAAVLGLFLGGLSLGYSLFGGLSRHLVRRARERGTRAPLLACYGAVEAAIGVYALLFPWIFALGQRLSLGLPTGGGPLAFGADVALAALLIAPPAVLMGATIPLLTQALARNLEDATRLHALVYALNTAGAFAGALAAGFALVPWLGLDGLSRAMGGLNLCAGAAYVLLGVRRGEGEALDARPTSRRTPSGTWVYAVAALAVGFAMMTCETVLIRIGGLALGSSEFTFSMVVAAFVLAIAVGSLAVSSLPRIGRAVLPATLWALLLALGWLYTRLDEAPYWGHVVRTFFTSRETVFHAYYGAAFLATLAVIGPPVALSGAVLPLLFDALRREVGDLGARAGRLYSQNTLGSLLGALIGGYGLLFWLDLHHVFRIALAALALAAALVTAKRLWRGRRRGIAGLGAALFAPAALALALLPPWDEALLSSGLFRIREAQPWTDGGPDAVQRVQLLFHEDDPTSTVIAVQGANGSRSIVVNGKPDGNTTGDLHTMALAALVPALLAEHVESAFVIGFGTGVTAGYLADLDGIARVTVAEISAGVLHAAPFFDFANQNASHNPKIEPVRSDAYRALLRSDRHYDVIVSEPSNPWEAGVEMLFSSEFLLAARDRLAPGGVYVQWYHVYENNDRSVELVLQTFARVFEDVAVWNPEATDVLLLGRRAARDDDLARLTQRAERPDFRDALARIGIHSVPALLVHEELPFGVVNRAGASALPPHTLVHPRLSYEAGRGFFSGSQAHLPFLGYGEPGRLARGTSLLRRLLPPPPQAIPDATWQEMIERACAVHLFSCPTLFAAWSMSAGNDAWHARMAEVYRRHGELARMDLVPLLRRFYGAPEGADGAGGTREALALRLGWYRERYVHAFPFPRRAVVALWGRCDPDASGLPFCRQGLSDARAYVAGGVFPGRWIASCSGGIDC